MLIVMGEQTKRSRLLQVWMKRCKPTVGLHLFFYMRIILIKCMVVEAV
jgi:hypothetical protein